MTHRVAVIGAGITGLTAARRLCQDARLQEQNVEITVYEASDRIGGKVITYRDERLTLEGGPDSILARKPAGIKLLRELGLASEVVEQNPASTHTYIVKDGKLRSMPQGTHMAIPRDISTFMQSDVLSAQGKLRTLFDLLLPRTDLSKDVSLGQFLRTRLGDEWVDGLAEPLLAGIYAGNIDELSLHATWPQFGQLADEYRSLIIGARSMHPKAATAPATQNGRSAFITVKGGLETVIERLADELEPNVTIKKSHHITKLEQTAEGYQLTVETKGDVTTATFDAVLVCTPVKAMKQLLDVHLPARSKQFDVPYVSTATVILGYPADSVDVDLSHASGFLVPRTENRAITASTWVSSKWPHTTDERFVILRCYVGRAGQQTYLSLDDAEMARLVQSEVRELVGLSASPVFHKVTRWNDAMPNYPVGHLRQWANLEADIRASLPGVWVAGGGYRGLGLPDCIVHGEEVAKAALSYLTQQVRSR
ncbi:protoporphyrinogen oxidase [Alicyclobacillus acidoterrestris]|uniref:protoporphyrinogen oxidase n=1 Tax=Alicyclobacillus suci TaxID=2816080 RepID=UPI00118EB59E|nr:protoporphyrinogen oxidase [Alicyclobacillus suci]GEO27147.1 protoporphyrinogen oxidase [Alicyclobacillus acidoterrestris]